MEDEQARELLATEYEVIAQHFVHWDTFFWTKANFFVAVEGVALLATAGWLTESTTNSSDKYVGIEIWMFFLLLGMTLLNLYLCWVWFLTGRRNRDFLNIRLEWAFEIEGHPLLQEASQNGTKPLIRIYHHQEEALKRSEFKGRSSHRWEMRIPIVFGAVWLAVLGIGLWHLGDQWQPGLVSALMIIVVGWAIARTLGERDNSTPWTPETFG